MTIDRLARLPDGPVLILGGSGMLGRAWIEQLRSRQIAFAAPSSSELDITNRKQIKDTVTTEYSAIINCAAHTNVDGSESAVGKAYKVNGRGAALLARRCAELKLPLVHYSTDYVFDGRGSIPYRTDHSLNPINHYGHSKAFGEVAVRASQCSALIIRTSWLFAPWGRNFVRTIFDRLKTGSELQVVADQMGRPTSAQYLAEASQCLLEGGYRGVWHVANRGHCSWYGLAAAIADELNTPELIRPCTSAEYVTNAKRPKYAILDITKTQNLLGIAPHWRSELVDTLAHFRKAESSRQFEDAVAC